MIPRSLEVYMEVNWLPHNLKLWLLLLLSCPFVLRSSQRRQVMCHRGDRQCVSTGQYVHPLKSGHISNGDAPNRNSIEACTYYPLKWGHLSNRDTSLGPNSIEACTYHPLKWGHLSNRDTSSGQNSIEACTYHPLKWGHLSNRDTSSGPNSIEACTYHPLKWGHLSNRDTSSSDTCTYTTLIKDPSTRSSLPYMLLHVHTSPAPPSVSQGRLYPLGRRYFRPPLESGIP